MQRGLVEAEDQSEVESTIGGELPDEAYNKAVLYLGLATVFLVIGSILLPAIGQATPEALWSALGAGIGGLAGIFMGAQ